MTEIGIGLPGRTVGDVRSSAEAAANYEFESFSVYGDLGDLPPYAVLHASAGALAGSSVKRVGPMGVPVGLQHPEIIAMHAAALEGQLPGQSYVGLVRGAFLDEIGERPAPLDHLEDTIHFVRNKFDGEQPPIYVGGFGPKLLRAAGRLAVGGVKLGGSVNPLLAEKARKEIANLDVKIVLGAVSVIDANREEARSRARYEVSKYLAAIGCFDDTLDGDELESFSEFMQQYRCGDIGASARISDALLDKFSLAGTPDDALARLDSMEGAVDVFEFGTPHGLGDRAAAIKYIGEAVVNERSRK